MCLLSGPSLSPRIRTPTPPTPPGLRARRAFQPDGHRAGLGVQRPHDSPVGADRAGQVARDQGALGAGALRYDGSASEMPPLNHSANR